MALSKCGEMKCKAFEKKEVKTVHPQDNENTGGEGGRSTES